MLELYKNSNERIPEVEILFEKKNFGKNLISNFCAKHYEFISNKEANEEKGLQFMWDQKIAYENIFVDVFKKQGINKSENPGLQLEILQQIDEEDYNLTSFLSNINFIDKLSNICEIMRITPPDNQLSLLHQELNDINKLLPSNIYIPFLSETIRNYIIVHIPISETRIFRTKNRAPYMLTVEVIRIDELIFYLNSIRKDRSNVNSETIRSYSFHTARKSNDEFIQTKNTKDKKKKVSPKQNEKDENNKNNEIKVENPIDYLKEQDVMLSKPVMIKNIKKNIGSTNNVTDKKHITNNEEDEEYKKIDQYIRQRVTISYKFDRNKKSSKSEIFFNQPEIDHSLNKLKDSEINDDIRLKPENSKEPETSIRNPQPFIEEEVKTTHENFKENDKCNNLNSQIFYDGMPTNKEVDNIFGEKIEEQSDRIKKISPFGLCSSWKLFKVIVKSGEDLRQEQFATQLINEFNQIFHLENVELWLKPYEILSTGSNCGLIECVPNAVSLDYLKRKAKNFSTLRQFFEQYFGDINRTSKIKLTLEFKKAIDNFVSSLAAYSLVCYFLQIKDRHNGNILIDDQGHIIHIDFGFMLSNAPGKGLQFEKAPFKLTNEFVEVIGGINSPNFSKFRKLLWKGFIAINKHHEKIIMLVEMMYCGHGNNLPCFLKGQDTIDELRQRLVPGKKMNKRDYISHVDKLIESSIDNWRTKWYDKFQYWFQGIFY